MKTREMLALSATAIFLVAAGAGASVYVMNIEDVKNDPPKRADSSRHVETRAAPTTIACNDDDIVGNEIGDSVGGTLLGEEYIPTHNVTCR